MFKQDLINLAHDKLTTWLNEPEWLTQKRQQALNKFQQLGLPTRKNELWKYTDLKRLEKAHIDVKNNVSVDQLILEKDEILITVHKNGFELLTPLPNGVRISEWSDCDENQWQNIETDTDRTFVEMNTAFLNTGLLINIDKSSQVNLHLHYQQDSNEWSNVRIGINLAENAHLKLKESFAQDCLINLVSVINVSKNASLIAQVEKKFSFESALIHYSKIICEESCEVKLASINKNGFVSHTIIDIDFIAERSNVLLASANLSEANTHISDNTHINHLQKHCKSEVIKRSLANDNGQVSVNAKAIVAKAADGSDVAQSLKNILMTNEAKIYSRPELEINTDDVVAAHGSTIGELDELSLSYLRSRGIPYQQAKNILIQSFLQESNIFKQEDFIEKIEL